jgi:hypothetical protein
MPLETLDSLANWTPRMRWADYYGDDPNEFAASRERGDFHRLRAASMQAALERLQPRSMQRQRERVEDIEDTQNELFDLENFEPELTRRRQGIDRIKGEFKREEAEREAGAEQERYFRQRPMREDKEAASMRALRQRYSDPAIIKGQADLQRELLRGGTARDVAGITGGSRERQEATRQFGDVTGAQVLGGDREAGQTGREELQGRMTPSRGQATISGPRGLQAYADAQGIPLEEAIAQAERLGYVVVD